MCDLWVLKTCRASVKVTVQNQPTTWMDDAASVVKMRRNCISFSHSLSSFSFIHAFSLSHPFIASFSYTLIPSHSLSLEAAWVEGGMKPQRAKRQHMPSSWGPLVWCVKGVGGIVLSLGGTRLAQAGSSLSSTGRPVLTWSPGFGRCWGGHSLGLVCGWGAYGLGHYLHRRAGG